MTDRSTILLRALCVAAHLNGGRTPTDALRLSDIDPAAVHALGDQTLSDLIDFGWCDDERIIIRRVGSLWQVERTVVVEPRPHTLNMAAHKLGKTNPKARHW